MVEEKNQIGDKELFSSESEEEKRIMRLRRIFDAKIDILMAKKGYDDIDEGELEAITESETGEIYLFTEDGRIDIWYYTIDGEDVILVNPETLEII